MPKELLDFFEKKQAKQAMYGAKVAAQGMRVLKDGAKLYDQGGIGPGDSPTVRDLENIRVLRSGDQNQFFLKQGDDQYAPLGDTAALKQLLGDERFRQYMVNTGFVPNTDSQGNIIPGYTVTTSSNDRRTPFERASAQFTDEYFGTYQGRGRDDMGRVGFGPGNYDRNQLQRAHYADYMDAQAPTIQALPEGMTGRDVVTRYDPSTMRRTQTEYLLGRLLGGQGGGQTGM